MSAETAAAIHSWAVGPRMCTLSVQRPRPGALVSACCEWSPTQPTRLSAEEWAQYRAGRNHALTCVASELGISVAVLEL
jgi:hypothetical protein